MLILIITSLVVALLWLARRHWALRRAVALLAESVTERRNFLHEDNELPVLHPSWARLVQECGTIVEELTRLRIQGAGQLRQLQATLGNLQEGVLIVDRDNYVLLANAALQRMFPRTGGATGQRLEVVVHSAGFLELLDAVRRGGVGERRELEFREQGRQIWIDATGALIATSGEATEPWCLFVLHDVTRQKELESIRKEFVANVSHELKTPLAMLRGYADTLIEDDGSLPAAQRLQFLGVIRRHADRLAAIVDDLLTLSRLESGGAVLQPAWQPVLPVVQSAVDEYREAFAASGHKLTVVAPAEPILASVDAMRITQVIANLLQNAQKYTPRGSSVEVGLCRAEKGAQLEIWVKDDGPGIPAADLPRIFERFYRVEKGRSREKGGTGLGLSIVKHIVHLHGGQVSAESRVGQGTRVSFRLPITQGEQPAALDFGRDGAGYGRDAGLQTDLRL